MNLFFFVRYIALFRRSDEEYPGTISLSWVKKIILIVKAINIIEYNNTIMNAFILLALKESFFSNVSSLETTTL